MAFYENIDVPAVHKRVKTAPRNFLFEGNELDMGIGTISVSTVGRLVDDSNNPILDEHGNFQYEPGDRQHVQVALSEALPLTINGITGVQVFEWICTWYEQQVTPVEPPTP